MQRGGGGGSSVSPSGGQSKGSSASGLSGLLPPGITQATAVSSLASPAGKVGPGGARAVGAGRSKPSKRPGMVYRAPGAAPAVQAPPSGGASNSKPRTRHAVKGTPAAGAAAAAGKKAAGGAAGPTAGAKQGAGSTASRAKSKPRAAKDGGAPLGGVAARKKR